MWLFYNKNNMLVNPTSMYVQLQRIYFNHCLFCRVFIQINISRNFFFSWRLLKHEKIAPLYHVLFISWMAWSNESFEYWCDIFHCIFKIHQRSPFGLFVVTTSGSTTTMTHQNSKLTNIHQVRKYHINIFQT